MGSLAENYQRVLKSIPSGVELIAVSKTRSVQEIQALYDLGHRAFGENYPQELRDKQPVLPADIEWHFIGHLQRSNVKYVVPHTRLIHGVDSEKLLDELNKRAAGLGRPCEVLLQVHIAQEDTKQGASPAELQALIQRPNVIQQWPNVRVRGLMGMASNTDDRDQVAREFATLAGLFRQIRATGPFPSEHFTELSMGMSGDADLAIAQGSTLVRIGTAIFGERQ
jgi:PLP dependent protein